jgi:UDP-glucose:(heptosyl)LPS alpha-1,3-glucosyltransferase
MAILLKSQVTQYGGLEKYASRIARGFIERGIDVTILTTYPGDRKHASDATIFAKKANVHAVQTSYWPAFRRMEQFDRFVQEYISRHPAPIIFGMDRNRFQTHYRAGNGVHAAFLKSRKWTDSWFKRMTFSFNPVHLKILEIEKAAFENPCLQKLFANSHMVRSEILLHYQVDASKIEVIHNGVEWHEMQSDFDLWPDVKPFAAKRLGLDPSLFHFLFIGNGYRRKGLGQLIIALSRLPSKDFHLSVVGKESHLNRYRALAARCGLLRQISFWGSQEDVRPFYQIADALVIPSFYDPFANVTIEALAMGLFVVSSKSNGGHEILNASNGIVIQNLFDPDSIAQALSIAMGHPKTQFRAHAIRQSVRHLDFSSQVDRLIDSCLSVNHE